MNKILSIITVNYNSGAEYKKTFESLRQFIDYEAVEFVVVDGGSDDASIIDINETGEHIDSLIVEQDRGIYDAMNKGINVAKGRWLWFVNCGDIISCKAAPLIKVLSSDLKANLIYSDFYAGGTKIGVSLDLVFLMRSALNHQNIIYKRELLASGFNLDFKICADYHHILNCYYDLIPLKYSECLCFYNLEGMSSEVSGRRRKQIWRERLYAQLALPSKYKMKYLMASFSLLIYLLKCAAPKLGSLTAKSSRN